VFLNWDSVGLDWDSGLTITICNKITVSMFYLYVEWRVEDPDVS